MILLRQWLFEGVRVLCGTIMTKVQAYPRSYLDSRVHGANMGPTWALSAPVGPMLAPWILLSGCILLQCLTYAMPEQCI